jgi:hypothetical protein
MQHQFRHHKWIFFVVALITLSIATPALADYLGPNRTVTSTRGVCYKILRKCKEVNPGEYHYRKMEDWLCSSESKPWKDYPETKRPCNASNKDYEYIAEQTKLETVTITHPSATIDASIQNCILQNGWCAATPPELILSANEPLTHLGFNIRLIEGMLNGVTFACPESAASCSITLNEGDNNFTYWALSTWGDSSTMGTVTARVDSVAPNVGVEVSGAIGANGWYVSPTTVTAAGSDATSGVGNALLSVDQVTWQPTLTLNEGIHALTVNVTDNAGNSSESFTSFSVDTTTPVIDMSVTGTTDNNGWYKSGIQVSALATDITSQIAIFEVSADGAAYQAYTNTTPIPFSDGHHTIRFRTVDAAGNQTETPAQEFHIDTVAPAIELPDSWPVGNTVTYNIRDDGSGLAALRVVIEDEDERYAKVAWDEEVSGSSYSNDIRWNGQFKDGLVAPPGTYLMWIKARDKAGHESLDVGRVTVPEPPRLFPISPPVAEPSAVPAALPGGPVADGQDASAIAPSTAPDRALGSTDGSALKTLPSPPAELFGPAEGSSATAPPAADPPQELSTGFGGGITESTATTTHSLLLSTGTAAGSAAASSPGILWGAAAAATIAAATAYALETTRKRKEAEAQQAAKVAQEMARDEEKRAEKKQQQQQNWLEQQALEESRREADRQQREDRRTERNDEIVDAQTKSLYAPASDWKPSYDAYMYQKAQEASAEELRTLVEYSNGEKQGEADVVTSPVEESWREKAKDATDKAWLWVDQHQTEIALGIGIVFGIAAIILSGGLAAPAVAAAWVAGAALAAGGTVVYGTLVLNAHYEREWHENLVSNLAVATITAAAVSGAWFLVQAATAAIGPFCYTHQTICGRIEPALKFVDWGEELWLGGKLAYHNWTGNFTGAAETALELQMEHMDGGMPGNAIAKELGEEALEKTAKYGEEALILVAMYGDDVIQIIATYGDDGITALTKYGKDAIKLIDAYGGLAVKVMDAVDPGHAQKLLKTLDDDVIEDVLKQGPDAVEALSGWSEKALSGYGVELALRAKKDAEVLARVRKLISLKPIDPNNLTIEQRTLIEEIAANSIYYGDEGQVVLGKWMDFGSGFTERALDTKSMFYSAHPDLWNLLGGLDNQADVAWMVNQKVIQTGIEKGLPFEYALNDIPTEIVPREANAIQAMFNGATDKEIMDMLRMEHIPVRMKELRELQKAGYEFTFDEINNSYILALP